MKPARYSTTRQKSCQACSNAKAKCDRRAGTCGRCRLRGLGCIYPSTTVSSFSSDVGPADPAAVSTPPAPSIASFGDLTTVGDEISVSPAPLRIPDARPSSDHSRRGLDFSSIGLHLTCPVNAEDIRNRWLNSYVPMPGQTEKALPRGTWAFLNRILKSYASVAVRGHNVLPFVHTLQLSQGFLRPPLSTCMSLVRVCERPLPGSESAAADVLQREMTSLYAQLGTYDDDLTLLAAFQAYLVYSLVLYFKLGKSANSLLRQAVMNLQEIACLCCSRGLVCTAEQQRARPKWEAWIVAEAKRRTLCIMYLFDNVLSINDGLPTFLATELSMLPTPGSKSLWRASDRNEWENVYNIHLVDWPDGGLRLEELWPLPPDADQDCVAKRSGRVDQWLEGVDEFGTVLFAVTNSSNSGH
jgi:hypothetical protein